ncbi:MAG: hypothetical protein JNL13_07950 [Chitinophagaceae bacterium]|nr:hypothetical protein [Chitinophagaceae bacterium]
MGKHYSYMTGDTILSGSGAYTTSPKMLKINCLAKTTAGATYTIEYVLNQ